MLEGGSGWLWATTDTVDLDALFGGIASDFIAEFRVGAALHCCFVSDTCYIVSPEIFILAFVSVGVGVEFGGSVEF